MADYSDTVGGIARTPVAPRRPARQSLLGRVRLATSTAGAAALGLLPHVLHHAGPFAGAALFAGVGGSVLFGAIGLVAAVPFLVRMERHCGSWRRPLATLALFAAMFSLSTFVVGPALSSGGGSSGDTAKPAPSPAPPAQSGHEQHH